MSEPFFADFLVRGDPKGQPRPRAYSRGGKASVYDPGTADEWKAAVCLAARGHLPGKPLDTSVGLSVVFYFPRPVRLLRKSAPDRAIPHMAKPDLDNLVKATLDALTDAGMWRDDALVSEIKASKFYAARGQAAGAGIHIFAEGL